VPALIASAFGLVAGAIGLDPAHRGLRRQRQRLVIYPGNGFDIAQGARRVALVGYGGKRKPVGRLNFQQGLSRPAGGPPASKISDILRNQGPGTRCRSSFRAVAQKPDLDRCFATPGDKQAMAVDDSKKPSPPGITCASSSTAPTDPSVRQRRSIVGDFWDNEEARASTRRRRRNIIEGLKPMAWRNRQDSFIINGW